MKSGRLDWIDYSKGLCIILLVMMQSAFGYHALTGSAGWMLPVALWAAPFVLPALFLISGFFLKRTLFGSKSVFFDRKILRFVYFYAVWLIIQTAFMYGYLLFSQPADMLAAFAGAWLEPAAGLWIIPVLVIFHAVTWLLRFVRLTSLLAIAAALQIFHAAGFIDTGLLIPDRFAEFYVFFYAGYAGSAVLRRYANALMAGFSDMPAVLLVWAAVNTALVAQGTADLPIVSLILGFAGAFAVIGTAIQLARKSVLPQIRHAGRCYLVIYLTCLIPMVTMQLLLARTGLIGDAGLASLVVTLAATTVPLGLQRLVRNTPFMAIYRRPRGFRLKTARQAYSGSLLTSPNENQPENA